MNFGEFPAISVRVKETQDLRAADHRGIRASEGKRGGDIAGHFDAVGDPKGIACQDNVAAAREEGHR